MTINDDIKQKAVEYIKSVWADAIYKNNAGIVVDDVFEFLEAEGYQLIAPNYEINSVHISFKANVSKAAWEKIQPILESDPAIYVTTPPKQVSGGDDDK